MRVNSWFSLAELKRLERLEKHVRLVILAIEGWTAPAIAMAVGLSRRVTQYWVTRYNADGDAFVYHEPSFERLSLNLFCVNGSMRELIADSQAQLQRQYLDVRYSCVTIRPKNPEAF